VEVARSVLEDDGGSFWCSSGSGDDSGDGGDDGGGGSFQRRLDLGGLDSMGRQHKLGRLWWLGFGWQQCRVKLLFIGGRIQHREFGS
jgi:hypothetical protein